MNGVPGGQQQQPPGMPDPINALQNLASQGKIVDSCTKALLKLAKSSKYILLLNLQKVCQS